MELTTEKIARARLVASCVAAIKETAKSTIARAEASRVELVEYEVILVV